MKDWDWKRAALDTVLGAGIVGVCFVLTALVAWALGGWLAHIVIASLLLAGSFAIGTAARPFFNEFTQGDPDDRSNDR